MTSSEKPSKRTLSEMETTSSVTKGSTSEESTSNKRAKGASSKVFIPKVPKKDPLSMFKSEQAGPGAMVNLEKIMIQMEYYFSNDNILTDNFMLSVIDDYALRIDKNGLAKTQAEGSPSSSSSPSCASESDEMQVRQQGWFPLKLLLRFPKLQSMTVDITALIEAAQRSKKLVLSSDHCSIKRDDSVLGNLADVLKEKAKESRLQLFIRGFHCRTQSESIKEFINELMGLENIRRISTPNMDVIIQSDTESENNHKKSNKGIHQAIVVSRFVGDVFVHLKNEECYEQWCHKSVRFDGRTLVIGPARQYWSTSQVSFEDSTLDSGSSVLTTVPFETDKVIYMRNVHPFVTTSDIHLWLDEQSRSDFHRFKAEYIWKESGLTDCYIRLKSGVSAKKAASILGRRSLLGILPQITVLSDSEAREIWNEVAVNYHLRTLHLIAEDGDSQQTNSAIMV